MTLHFSRQRSFRLSTSMAFQIAVAVKTSACPPRIRWISVARHGATVAQRNPPADGPWKTSCWTQRARLARLSRSTWTELLSRARAEEQRASSCSDGKEPMRDGQFRYQVIGGTYLGYFWPIFPKFQGRPEYVQKIWPDLNGK
eukprot:s5309_g1.t2